MKYHLKNMKQFAETIIYYWISRYAVTVQKICSHKREPEEQENGIVQVCQSLTFESASNFVNKSLQNYFIFLP